MDEIAAKHPTVISVLRENKGRMDWLSAVGEISKKHNMTVNWGIQFLEWAQKDGVCRKFRSGLYHSVELLFPYK